GVVVGAVYTSAGELFPVLPILGWVHQPPGSRLRLDVFLPRHVRAEYELSPRLRGALGAEAVGNRWAGHAMQSEQQIRRVGGVAFGELGLIATALVRVEARAGLAVERYTLPEMTGGSRREPLRPAGFAQLAVVVTP